METLAEPLTQPIAIADAKPKGKHLFSGESARLNGRKGAEARRQALANLKAAVAKRNAIAELEPDEQYKLKQVARTREAIDKLWNDFHKTRDAKEQKAIADAIGRLSDLLFALSGWSKPGLTRPSSKKPAKPEATGPIE